MQGHFPLFFMAAGNRQFVSQGGNPDAPHTLIGRMKSAVLVSVKFEVRRQKVGHTFTRPPEGAEK